MAAVASSGVKKPHLAFITISVMLTTLMPALDMTIANVALTHIQGTMGTTQDQVSWVLTSYIVSAAIFMPVTGFLSGRFGRKRVFIWSVLGFTAASMFCGAAQNLSQLVLFRLLQGMFGASLMPLSQAVLLDTYPSERHGSAMAIWGVGVMVGPVLGPLLGGILTEYYSWRWVFYINLPFGILAWFGVMAFVRETSTDLTRQFDFFGFLLLSLGIGALQLMLDRGQSLDWFASQEVALEALLAGLSLYLFTAHILTHQHPYIDPSLFIDRNFSVGLVVIFIVGVIMFATMALLPPYLQTLLGYSAIDTGYLLAPRGVGTMFAMITISRLSGRIDVGYKILLGLILTVISLWEMSQFDANITEWTIVRTGITQGLGLGFIFAPLSAVTFSTLPPRYRNEGTALFSLLRNIGSSIGISAAITFLARNTQENHAAFAVHVNPFNLGLTQATETGIYDLTLPQGLAAINDEITRQAAMLAYLQDFRVMMWITVAAIPLILLLRNPRIHAGATRADFPSASP